jgi:hypothetical protein
MGFEPGKQFHGSEPRVGGTVRPEPDHSRVSDRHDPAPGLHRDPIDVPGPMQVERDPSVRGQTESLIQVAGIARRHGGHGC